MSDSDESGVTYTEITSTFEELSDIGSSGVEDEVFSAEEQPLPATASPTAQLPDYVSESDPEADPEEDDDEDPEEDSVDYPADDDEEEEDHPAPADSVVVAFPATDQAPSAEETKPFETDESAATPPPHPAYRVTARISILAPVPTPVWSDAEVARLLAISTPPSSPLSPWSSPLPQIPSLPLPVSPPLPVSSPVPVLSPSSPASPIRIALGPAYEVEESSSAAARPARGLRTDYGFVATTDREIRRDPERDVGYRITDSWDEIVETLQGALVSTDTELGRHMTTFETRVMQDTDEIYTRLDDEQSGRQLLAGRLNMLFRDRRAHARTARLIETEARMSREAWGLSMDASDLARVEVMSLRTTMLAQQSEIRELQSVDRRRQTMISEMLAADQRRQKQLTEVLKLIKRLPTQMAEFERQQGPAKGPAQLELPEEASSSS
ncbi:hypothetical protein Tco_1250962 [Tanacetum coccineum]